MFAKYPVLGRVGLLFLDTLVTVFSFIVAVQLRNAIGLSADVHWKYYMNLILIIIIIWAGLSEYQEAYAGSAFKSGRYSYTFKSLRKEVVIIFRTVLIGCPLVYMTSLGINLFTRWDVPKSLIVIFGIVNFLMLSLERFVLYNYVELIRRRSRNIKKVVVLGTGDIARHFIDSSNQGAVEIIGLIGKEKAEIGNTVHGQTIVGSKEDFKNILHSSYIDEFVVALPAKSLGDIEEIITTCDKEGIPVRIVSPFFRNLISKSRTEIAFGLPNIMFLPVERNDLEVVLKRIVDLVVALIGLILLLPFFILIVIIIKLDSPGPVFYEWRVLGLHKKPLVSHKFRTMVENADELREELMHRNEMKGAAFKISDDPRITRIGRWLRKYSLDELPQLWSVLKGDLSLVGPRPPLQREMEHYKGWHRRKLSVKPGLTCLWQTSGRNEITDFDEWMRLDLKYIDEWTLWLDIKILFNTIGVILRGTGK